MFKSGNLMYCMPKVGTRATLYLPGHDPGQAVARTSPRENGDSCGEMNDPQRRCFTSEHGKRMCLFPERMVFSGGAPGETLRLRLDDLSCLALESTRAIRIVASLDISVQAPRVTLSTPQELCTSRSPLRAQGQIALLIPKGTGGGNPPTGGGDTSLVMQYQFDALGQEGILCGTDFQFYHPFPDTPAEFDFGSWIANIALGVAVAAACVLATVLFPGVGAIGSAALIGAAMGALAVTATIAMEDMADGEVRSWQAAFGQTLLGATAGAMVGLTGWYVAPHGVATMSTFIKFGVLSGATMRVATGNAMEHLSFDEYMGHIFNPLSMVTDGLFGGLFGGATNYFRLGTAFPSQSMVNAYNASQAALQSMQAAGAASQADEAANGTKNSNPSVSEGGIVSKGTLTGKLDGLTTAERTIVDDLLNAGNNVEIIPRSNIPGNKTPDFLVNGVKTELKTLTGTSLNTPVTRIQDGFKQGAEAVIIDGRNTGLTLNDANTVIERALGKYGGELPGIVEIWTAEGIIRR